MTNPLSAGSPNINATVMASAGTGKTWLLVTRLVRLLLAGVRPDAILAITFTRKAAAEMQTRLNERLFELACTDEKRQGDLLHMMGAPSDPETRSRARSLYEGILRARQPVRTTTFHAFCQEILRRFPLEADVPPGFELVERTGELERAAWEHLMAEATTEPDGIVGRDLEQLLNYAGGLDGLKGALFDFLGRRSDWWAYTEGRDEPAAWAASEAARHLESDPSDLDPRIEFLAARADELRDFAELLLRHPVRDNPNLADGLGMAAHAEIPIEARFEAAAAAFLRKDGEVRSRKASQAQAKKMTEAGQERFLKLHASLCERVLTVRDALSRRETTAATGAWYRLGQRLVEHFQRFKEEQRLLDFADLEWRAYRLLSVADNAHWVQYKLDQRIDHLLVDEFQDTNPTQWRLLLPLLEEMAAGESERRRSVFLVGDVKQSIYRFRRADPRLLPAAHDWLSGAMAAHSHTLHISRRSAAAVIDCVNRVFGPEGPLANGLAEFAEHDTFHSDLWGRVELLPLVEESDASEQSEERETDRLRDPLTEPRRIANDGRHLQEGRQIAARIAALIAEQTPIGGTDQARPSHFGDVLILIRSRTHAGDYEAALREAGIPYVGADRGTLLEALEVRDLVALLEVLITPYNHLSIATVLRSPLFGCSDNELIALAHGKGGWLERLGKTAAELSPAAPLSRAHRLLSGWRRLAGRMPIHDLLDRVYSEGNVLARYEAAFPKHLQPRIRANLGRFLELALEIDAGRYPSLTGFIAKLSQLREFTGEAPDEAPARGGERVRVMTIHAAKGLEAPVVFLADAAAARQNDPPFRALVDWPAGAPRPKRLLLVGRKAQQDTITRNQLELDKAAEQREQSNLLYVALTRARQMLFISGCRPRRGEELGWYGLLKTALDKKDEATAPPVLESGKRPDSPIQGATQGNRTISVPVALGHAIDPPLSPLEVAPSSRVVAAHTGSAQHTEEDALLRGVVIHRMLELTVRGDTSRIDEAVAQEFGLDVQEPEFRSWWGETQSLLKRTELAPVFRPGPGCLAFCEVPVAYRRDDGCVIHGIIDRLIVSAEQLWVVDYKTHRRAREENLRELANPYCEQLRLYAQGVARLWPGRPVRASLLFTAAGALYDMAVENASTETALN